MDTFDMQSLAGNKIFHEIVRTSMRKVGPQIVMALQRVINTEGVDNGDQAIALKAVDAVSAILARLGVSIGGNYQGVTLEIDELILSLLASDAVDGVTYDAIKAGSVDGSIRPAVDTVLYQFLLSMTGLNQMTQPAQAVMAVKA